MVIVTHQELLDEIKNAMRAQDKPRLAILRQVNGEIKNIEVDERREITDQDVSAMFKRVLKQTKETYDGSVKAATNQERTALLEQQIQILESYLPVQLTGEKLQKLVQKIVEEGGYSTKRDMGAIMQAIGNQTNGNFDKAAAARIAGDLLS